MKPPLVARARGWGRLGVALDGIEASINVDSAAGAPDEKPRPLPGIVGADRICCQMVIDPTDRHLFAVDPGQQSTVLRLSWLWRELHHRYACEAR